MYLGDEVGEPDDTACRSWRNRDDATRDGAYVVSLAVVERELGLVALSRSLTRALVRTTTWAGQDCWISKRQSGLRYRVLTKATGQRSVGG